MYKLTNTSNIIRTEDGATIPAAQENIDYETYLAWVASGNTPAPADIPDPAIEVAEKLARVREVREAILNRLAGIAGRAMRSGDTALASACDSASVALLDLPSGCPTDPALVDAFITNKYAAIRAGMPAALILAFAGVDA